MRYLLTIQYLGTRYAGWQTQANATGIQQLIERALSTMCNAPVKIEGSGRTDAGVHARAQRAHVDLQLAITARGVRHALNNLLPSDIRIADVREVDPAFHARFHADGKTYAYRIWNGEFADVFRAETHAHVVAPLDADAMHQAAQSLLGEHDFAAFTVRAPEVSSTRRTVRHVAVERSGEVVTLSISADGFLRFMVRRIAGSLIEIGRGRLPVTAMAASLEPRFSEARWTAPSKGLTLESVHYARL